MKKGGTGGANTNANGLSFESKTDLATAIQTDLSNKYKLTEMKFANKSTFKAYTVTRLSDNKDIGIITQQTRFYDVMKAHYNLDNANHKKWKPDEVFFNFEANTVFIVEKKWQSGQGSVDEKVLGFVNKRRLYQSNFNQLTQEPKPTVQFCALFNSSWWLNGGKDGNNAERYQDSFDILRMDSIKIFFDTYDYWWFGL
ncbi:hypothetical protein M5361_13745 [Ligilactobacillus agilis]|nr:hypothetical protein [Ligilactobacillus agilis]